MPSEEIESIRLQLEEATEFLERHKLMKRLRYLSQDDARNKTNANDTQDRIQENPETD
jgi:hypothetical protein